MRQNVVRVEFGSEGNPARDYGWAPASAKSHMNLDCPCPGGADATSIRYVDCFAVHPYFDGATLEIESDMPGPNERAAEHRHGKLRLEGSACICRQPFERGLVGM